MNELAWRQHFPIYQYWPTGFRDIQVKKCEIFVTQGQVSKMSGLIRPKMELDRAFMPVLDTSNFDDDSIKNERASMEKPFSHYKSMGIFLDAQGQLTLSHWSHLAEIRDFMHVLVTCKYKRIGSKATEKRWRHHFPHYKSMGAFCYHGHQIFDHICLKTLCSFSLLPVMLYIKFD